MKCDLLVTPHTHVHTCTSVCAHTYTLLTINYMHECLRMTRMKRGVGREGRREGMKKAGQVGGFQFRAAVSRILRMPL